MEVIVFLFIYFLLPNETFLIYMHVFKQCLISPMELFYSYCIAFVIMNL